MPFLFLKSERDLARLMTKARQLKGRRARVKTRGKSPLSRPKMQPRRRKHRPRPHEVNPKAKDALSSQPSENEDPSAKA